MARREREAADPAGQTDNADTASATRDQIKNRETPEPRWGDIVRARHGEPPESMARPHGHHVVYKDGVEGPMRDACRESQRILEEHDIDWLRGDENLGWAPNHGRGNHTVADAEATRDALREASERGASRDELTDILRQRREEFIRTSQENYGGR